MEKEYIFIMYNYCDCFNCLQRNRTDELEDNKQQVGQASSVSLPPLPSPPPPPSLPPPPHPPTPPCLPPPPPPHFLTPLSLPPPLPSLLPLPCPLPLPPTLSSLLQSPQVEQLHVSLSQFKVAYAEHDKGKKELVRSSHKNNLKTRAVYIIVVDR